MFKNLGDMKLTWSWQEVGMVDMKLTWKWHEVDMDFLEDSMPLKKFWSSMRIS